MRIPLLLIPVLGASALALSTFQLRAADGVFYGPSSPASKSAKTTGRESSATTGLPAAGAVPARFVLEGVNFANNEAMLNDDVVAILNRVAVNLRQWGDVKIEVAGHTDSAGSEAYNLGLSQRRADAVRTYLIGLGIAPGRLTARGYGESSPVADNASGAGRHKNRRVELVPLK